MASEDNSKKSDPSIDKREAEARIAKLSVETRVLQERASLDKEEARAKIVKFALEARLLEEKAPMEAKETAARLGKLETEKHLLVDQLTLGFKGREWLKALTGLAAILALGWTV